MGARTYTRPRPSITAVCYDTLLLAHPLRWQKFVRHKINVFGEAVLRPPHPPAVSSYLTGENGRPRNRSTIVHTHCQNGERTRGPSVARHSPIDLLNQFAEIPQTACATAARGYRTGASVMPSSHRPPDTTRQCCLRRVGRCESGEP